MTTATTAKRSLVLATVLLGLACALTAILPDGVALALEEPAYTPGENYYIDEEEAFLNQDVDHGGAVENQAATSYYLTSPFYLNWISPDTTVYEGEVAYIGCGATGLQDIRYEWLVSRDGGETFDPAGLNGPEHTVYGLQADAPEERYLFRCVVTNGDRTSQLEADVQVTVIDVPEPAGGLLGELGDQTMALVFACVFTAFMACAVALPLILTRYYRKRSNATAPRTCNRDLLP